MSHSRAFLLTDYTVYLFLTRYTVLLVIKSNMALQLLMCLFTHPSAVLHKERPPARCLLTAAAMGPNLHCPFGLYSTL